MEQLEILNHLYDGLQFKDAVYAERTNICTVNFLYNPQLFKPAEESNKIILDKVIEIVGDYVKFELNFIACPLDKRAIANHAYITLVNDFPALSRNLSFDDVAVDISGVNASVTYKLSPSSYEYAVLNNRQDMLAAKLKESFLADFTINFVKKNDEIVSSAIENNAEFILSIKQTEDKTVFKLTELTKIIGNNEYSLAIDYRKISEPVENVVICGVVTNISKRTYNRQRKKDGQQLTEEHTYYSFALKNDDKILYCNIFPRQADEIKGDLIEQGMSVCCFGSFRKFNGKLNFTAVSIARCKFEKEEIKHVKHVNENYHTVFPQQYVEYTQSDLFGEEDKHFAGKYVVFDLETTGFDANKDTVIQIGACKIVDGRITETFSTFVNPSRHIPAEITELTGINDQMVKDAPTINYVLPDFYKFCDGCTLVAQNIAFDISFLHSLGKQYSYEFNHPQMDTLEMARLKLPGLKNYKLATIAEKLNVPLIHAHTATDDATATAKVFIKLI